MSNVYEKLQNARVVLQNKKLKKSGKNKFSGFDYYELSDFLPQVNQIFADLKLCSRFDLKENIATLTIIDSEDDKQTIEFTSPTETLDLKGCNRVQAIGGVHTYMRRYLYQNALEIVENDMFDAQTGKIEEIPKKKPEIKKDDTAIYEQVSKCQTVDELNDLWTKEHKNVSDAETFKNICASRKSVITETAKAERPQDC